MAAKTTDLLKLEESAVKAFNRVMREHDFGWSNESDVLLLEGMGQALQGIAAIRAQRLKEEEALANNGRRRRSQVLGPINP